MTDYRDDWLEVYGGDARTVLATLPAESVHCVITSPPYWGLRDYGTPGQLGLEPALEAYVAALVDVFREVRRVLRPDGTVWLNLGDSFASSGGERTYGSSDNGTGRGPGTRRHDVPASGLKPKDLVGIPWRVAFALQADGWYLRSDIVWSKPNPMPESVTDRPTKAHEYVFLLSKSARYYYDADAVREPPAESVVARAAYMNGGTKLARNADRNDGDKGQRTSFADYLGGRNLRSVWTIATAPYPGAHFATFPPRLVEPCVKAGTPECGVCPECGAPWARVTERATNWQERRAAGAWAGNVGVSATYQNGVHGKGMSHDLGGGAVTTTGWRPTCGHGGEPVPATVLDPFAGTGTVGVVAQSLSRRAVLIDLNAEYLVQCLGRNRQVPLGLGS